MGEIRAVRLLKIKIISVAADIPTTRSIHLVCPGNRVPMTIPEIIEKRRGITGREYNVEGPIYIIRMVKGVNIRAINLSDEMLSEKLKQAN